MEDAVHGHERERIDPYQALEVARDATPAEIRAAYFAQVRLHPPERDPDGFKRVREAYEQLRSARKRAEMHLLELRQGPEEFSLERLHDAPRPPFPEGWVGHLVAIALEELDARIDAGVAAMRDAARAGHWPTGGNGGPGC